jgi:hypothetical protein
MYYTWFLRHANQKDNNDIELFKEQAMRIIANDGFDWEKEAYNSDTDNDGYKASLGGEDEAGVGKDVHCFFHDMEKGREYEFRECKHLFPNAPGAKTGDGVFNRSEERFWHTNPNDPDTGDYGRNDEATIAGLGQNIFSWTYKEGDQVGVVVEGVSFEPTSYRDASYKVMWALPKNKCDLIDDAFRDPSEGASETVTVSPEIWPSCPGGCSFTRTVTKTSTTYEQATYSSYQIGTTITTTKTEVIQIHPTTSTTGGTATATGGTTPTATVNITTETSDEGEAPSNETCYAIDGISADSGITDRSCCPAGNDYCSVLSTRTETTNPSRDMDIDQKDKDRNLFKMTVNDFNKCLLKNFIDPTEGGGKYQKINMELTYSPENPINDPQGNNSDEISINASVLDYKDANFLYYNWEIFSSESMDGPWQALTKTDLKESSPTMGLGAKNLRFRLNFPESVSYLKAKLSITENAYNGEKKGNEEIIIPLNNNSNRIKVFSAQVSPSLNLTPETTEKCFSNNKEDPVCKVAKNQILAVQIDDSNLDNFLWTINGKPIDYSYSPALEKAPNPAYFPVLQEVGENFNLSLIATNKSTGKKVNLGRFFSVVNPSVKIISLNKSSCSPIKRGEYTDSEGKVWDDFYDNLFQAKSGESVSLQANFSGAEPKNPKEIIWYLDGEEAGTGKTFEFTTGEAGTNHSISVLSTYKLDDYSVQALDKFWNSPKSLFYEKEIGNSIEIKSLDTLEEAALKSNKRAMASMFSSIPQYLSFLLRIFLTAFLMIFTAKIIFNLSSNKFEN